MNCKVDLKPGERCPYCGQRRRKTKKTTTKAVKASRANGMKGGRPKKSNEA